MGNFDKIAGYNKEKEQLQGLRELLLNLEAYKESGIRIPRGVLLYGAPGVGKTVMARSIAGEGINFVELRSADCTQDDAAKYVQEAFVKARAATPCVLLIDELDKITESSHEYFVEGNDRVMKVLLQELDGQKDNSGVLVVATCNDFSYINGALLRSGRFDRMIKIDTPSFEDRMAIIEMYLSGMRIAKKINVEYFAKITGGYTGAQLECVINEAAILALESKADAMLLSHIQTAINRISFRALEGDMLDVDERRKTAVHEAGHALVGLVLSPDKVASATVIPQGETRGHMRMMRRENVTGSVSEVEREVAVAMAGAAAEKLILGELHLGCTDDYEKASRHLMHLIGIGAYGFDMILVGATVRADVTSAGTLEKVAAKRCEMLTRMDALATEIIQANRAWYDRIVDALVERCALTREEMEELREDGARSHKISA